MVMPLSQLLTDPTLELVSGSRPPLCSEEMLAGIPEVAVEQARWWERHIVEVLTGRQPGVAPGTRPRPQFDTAKRSLRQRELAKLEELRAAGHKVSRNALQRRRFSYERDGLLGGAPHRVASQAVGWSVSPVTVSTTRPTRSRAAGGVTAFPASRTCSRLVPTIR